MPRQTRKTRIPIDKDESADALFASDMTCCVCRRPRRRLQIHHLDDDPSNNVQSNLAVLCLECHDQTQISGGFGRKLSAPAVKKYRDEWLQVVEQKRAQQRGQETHVPTRRAVWRMTPEQARERAQRLRSLYATFFTGVGYTRDFVVQMGNASHGASLEEREARLKSILTDGCKMIDSTLPEIRIEPGSQQVCELYIEFRTLRDRCMTESVFAQDYRRVFLRVSRDFALMQLDQVVRKLQAAIHAHIESVDRLT